MSRSARIGFVAACLFYAASLSSFGQAAPHAGEHHPLPKPTNLKVLPKNISPEDLMKTMHSYSGALGVHCDFCHEIDKQTHKANFASDAKPDKAIARTMIAMTQEINSRFMSQINDPDAMPADKTVTCGTCHRGNTMPKQFTPKPEPPHAHGDMH